MKVALIILNYNDYDNTSKYCSLIQNYDIINKIIIVDNNSTNEKEFERLSALTSEKIEVIESEKNGGYAYGNNFGLYYLDKKYPNEFDYIIISNPDVSVEESAIKNTLDFLENSENAVIATPRMHFTKGPARRSAWKERKFLIDVANSTRVTELLLYPLLKKGEYAKNDFEEKTLKVDAVAGSFFIANYNKFKKIGYFDENTFLFFEEDIIGKKAKEAGYDIYSLNDIKFIHYDSQCIGRLFSMFKKQDILFESRIYYHKTYHNIGRLKVFLFKLLKYVRKVELLFEIPIRKTIKK